MHENRYCIIMAGGTSHKLWPVSRDSRPKQFLKTDSNGKSFVRLTYDRFASFIPKENILVVTLSKYADLVKEQIPGIAEENILLEPYSRNTAPCIAYSTYKILKRNPDAVVVTSPSDHIIEDQDAFVQTISSIMDNAEAHPVLMTLGITPTRPASSYGYIQVSGIKETMTPGSPAKVKTFVEKPTRELAEVFCNSGEFYWNSGVFAWQAKVIKEELEKHTPEVTALFNGWEQALDTDDEALFLAKAYGDCPKISIDYGVMENTDRAWLFPADFGWKDTDTWEAVYKDRKDNEKDKDGNCVFTGKSLVSDDKRCLFVSSNPKKLYAIKGLEDFIVIDTDDALLICPRDNRKYKDLVSGLGMPGYEEFR